MQYIENNNTKYIKYFLFFIFLLPPYITIKLGSFPGINPERLFEFYFVLVWGSFYFNNVKFRKNINEYLFQYKYIFITMFFIYLLQFFSSLFFSINTIKSIGNMGVKFIGQGFLVLLIIGFINKKNISYFIRVILLFEFVLICLGGLEWVLQKPLFSALTFLNSDSTDSFSLGIYRGDKYRVISTMPHALVLSQILLILLPFNHYFLKLVKRKSIYLANVILTPLLILFTDSRMGVALYILFYSLKIFSLIFYFKKNNIKYIVKCIFYLFCVFVLCFVFYFLFNFDSVLYYFDTLIYANESVGDNSSSSYARIIQLNIAYDNISWLGYGMHAVETILDNYVLIAMDNYYISIFLQSGIIGLFLYLMLIFFIFKLISLNIHKDKSIVCFFYFYCMYVLYSFILSIDYLMNLFFIFLGFLMVILKNNKVSCDDK